jgi:Ca-activated chloride channel family protein
MTEKTFDVSRRTVLAGLGTVGVAAAGAGLGTTALFNDTERFVGNTLRAGTLDLKLDYKATYMGGPGRLEAIQQEYPEAEDLGDGNYLLMQAPSPADMQAWEDMVTGEEFDFCSDEADEYLANGDDIPVFTLDDVKPGDYGEVTISLHICDNPAYMRMNGEIVENSENGQTEPELLAEGEDTDGIGELADLMQARVWYDEDCDNVYEPTGTGESQELEVALVTDVSGSMGGSTGGGTSKIAAAKQAAEDFVDNLASPDEAAAISFSNSGSLDQELTTNYQAVKDAIDQYVDNGSTNMTAGIDIAHTELMTGSNATTGASKVMIVLTDGVVDSESSATAAATAAKDDGIRVFTVALGNDADESFLENSIASTPGDAFVAPDAADLDTIYAEIAQIVLAGEAVIVEGTFSEVFDFLSTGDGVDLDGNRIEEGIQCYPGATTQCIGFEWSLPTEVGNEVQSDSISFDVGFEAEQCRHNDAPFAEEATTN